MNVLIIEDEAAAARHLQSLIAQLPYAIRVLAVLETVRASVQWLQSQPPPDLIISDIQLADGSSFGIFSAVPVAVPIIFTTAYDEYMQRAFKLHSIDYLLKPVKGEELRAAFDKYSSIQARNQQQIGEQLSQILRQAAVPAAYKTRFLVKTGDRLSTVPAEQVLLLHADDRIVTLHDRNGRKFILDDSLDDLEPVLDPHTFFRLNRSYIVPLSAIDRVQHHFNGKLHVRIKSWSDDHVFVSREKAKRFKQWLDGNFRP